MKAIVTSGILSKIESMADRGAKLTVRTNELTPEDAGHLMALTQTHCNFLIGEVDGKELEEVAGKMYQDTDPFAAVEGKTPSQRLRAVLYLNWQQNSKGFQTADDHYRHEMEKIISHFKSKLDE